MLRQTWSFYCKTVNTRITIVVTIEALSTQTQLQFPATIPSGLSGAPPGAVSTYDQGHHGDAYVRLPPPQPSVPGYMHHPGNGPHPGGNYPYIAGPPPAGRVHHHQPGPGGPLNASLGPNLPPHPSRAPHSHAEREQREHGLGLPMGHGPGHQMHPNHPYFEQRNGRVYPPSSTHAQEQASARHLLVSSRTETVLSTSTVVTVPQVTRLVHGLVQEWVWEATCPIRMSRSRFLASFVGKSFLQALAISLANVSRYTVSVVTVVSYGRRIKSLDDHLVVAQHKIDECTFSPSPLDRRLAHRTLVRLHSR